MSDDIEILLSEDFRRTVEANLGRDPLRIALDRRLPHAALVASQVKYLRRAAGKLPSYYSACCVLPPRAFEQASSEATAERKEYSGELAIDLTCGLGVDSFALAKRFGRVIAIERDTEVAEVARENFRRLGVDNVLVVNASAEEFLKNEMPFEGRADLVYVDPDRRGVDGKKMVRVEDCSPDVLALRSDIERIASRLVVKLSPMFDVDEVFRVFGRTVRARVVSLGGECKEIVAEVAGDIAGPTVRAVAIGAGEVEYPSTDAPVRSRQQFEPERYTHLVVPDVALQKARLARRYLGERGVWIESENGYGFAVGDPGLVIGRAIEIESVEPFDPKGLKRRLKGRGVKNIDVLKREFPLSTAAIVRQLGVREGGGMAIAFTRAGGELWQIVLKS